MRVVGVSSRRRAPFGGNTRQQTLVKDGKGCDANVSILAHSLHLPSLQQQVNREANK